MFEYKIWPSKKNKFYHEMKYFHVARRPINNLDKVWEQVAFFNTEKAAQKYLKDINVYLNA